MYWQRIAKEKMKDYADKKEALINIKLQLEALEAEATSLKGFATDRAPVCGGGDAYSDRQLDIIVEKNELIARYNLVAKQIKPVDNALSKLSDDERYILDIAYIHPRSSLNFADLMYAKYIVEKTEAYNRRNAVLRKFTLLMYGAIED